MTWDNDMADRGYNVFMYDHTIKELPEKRAEFHFFKKGIAGETRLPFLDTLEQYIEMNHHENESHMILKMDVEGAEWESLLACPESILNQFDQIVLEIHDMVVHDKDNEIIKTLEKINHTHALIHIHANNCGYEYDIEGHKYTDAFEVTYVNKSVFECIKGGELYTKFDAPNKPDAQEVYLSLDK